MNVTEYKIFELTTGDYSGDYNKDEKEWKTIKCECGSFEFNIIKTDRYETTARCIECGFMDIIHDG